MSADTGIEWTDATWNPLAGCSVVSPGCTSCYAMRFAGRRLDHLPLYKGLTQSSKAGPVWTGEVRRASDHVLYQPLRWKKPKRIFVNSMSDLFHEAIPSAWIDRVFDVMEQTPRHVFQVLTKRSARMLVYLAERYHAGNLPPAHIWIGVSAEDQTRWTDRVGHLLQAPAAVRFVSVEPMLGPVEGDEIAVLDWIICGGESGKDARAMHPDWARRLRDLCATAGTSFFFKQWGEYSPYLIGDGWNDGPNRLARRAIVKGSDGRVMAMFKHGKKSSGRLLDGVEHRDFPQPRAA